MIKIDQKRNSEQSRYPARLLPPFIQGGHSPRQARGRLRGRKSRLASRNGERSSATLPPFPLRAYIKAYKLYKEMPHLG
jgi:hypothetical protein